MNDLLMFRNHGLPDGTVNTPLFDRERLPYVVHSRPLTESRQLTLLFPVPDTDAFIGSGTLRFIGHLIGHEGETSLLTYLKDAGYANGLMAGESIGMGKSRSFSISVSLTLQRALLIGITLSRKSLKPFDSSSNMA